MVRRRTTPWLVVLAGVGLVVGAQATATGQEAADVAARLSGQWQMNLEMSPQFRPNPQGSLAQPGGGVLARRPAGRPVPRLVLAVQRGGGRGGRGGSTPADPQAMAGAMAIRTMQQVPQTMTIAATADAVTFTDPRGPRSYAIDNKTTRVEVGDGAQMTTRTRWDGDALRQEFIVGETRVTHIYEVNDEGTRIEFTLRVANFSGGPGREAEAVYDKVP